MQHLKMLVFAPLALIALLAPATTSATQLTSPSGTVYTGTIQMQSEGSLELHGSFSTISCGEAAMGGAVASHGAATTTRITLSSVTFLKCNFPFKVLKPGSLEIHTETSTVNNGNGTVTWSGLELTWETSIANCLLSTTDTDIGTLTGSDTGKGTLDINSAKIPRTGHSIFCGSSVLLTGSYTFTTPSTLTVD